MRLILRATFAIAVALLTIPVLTNTANGDDAGAGIALVTPDGARSLSAPIAGAPGATEDRLEDVELVGPGSVGALTMTVERTRTSALDQTALRYSVERCDTAWVSDGKTYTCPTNPQVLRTLAPLGPRADEIALGGVRAGAKAHLRVRFTIAADAGREVIGQSSALEWRIRASL